MDVFDGWKKMDVLIEGKKMDVLSKYPFFSVFFWRFFTEMSQNIHFFLTVIFSKNSLCEMYFFSWKIFAVQ